MKEQIQNLSEEFFDEIVSVRRHLHMNPELSFEEYETSKYIKQLLLSWKIDYEDDFENNGISVLIKGNSPDSRVLALRADFDALPIKQFFKRQDNWYERFVDLTNPKEAKFIEIKTNVNKKLWL